MTSTPLSSAQVAALLAELAGPRGPMATEDLADWPRRRLLHGPPAAAAAAILAAVADRPTLPPAIPVTWDDINHEAADLLSELAEEPAVPPLLTAALDDAATRPVALEALALAADPATTPALAALAAAELEAPFLPEDDLIQLISALGATGGPEAVATVHQFQQRSLPPAVTRELAIAAQTLDGGHY